MAPEGKVDWHLLELNGVRAEHTSARHRLHEKGYCWLEPFCLCGRPSPEEFLCLLPFDGALQSFLVCATQGHLAVGKHSVRVVKSQKA